MLAEFSKALAARGLNLVGCADAAAARAHWFPRAGEVDPLAGAARVVVCGSGGRGHWQRLTPAQRRQPHPINADANDAVDRALPRLPPGSRRLADDQAQRFDLRRLAVLAGLGALSPHLLLVLHPEFGPWVSLRALVAVPSALPTSAPLRFDPCTSCPRPCLDACPAGAYDRDHPFDARRCAEHRLAEETVALPCASFCRSRLACPVGREHAYSDEEYRHRHRANLPALRSWHAGGG